jgi:hypothetical protein
MAVAAHSVVTGGPIDASPTHRTSDTRVCSGRPSVGRAMRQSVRLGTLAVLIIGLITIGSASAGATSNHVSGVGVFDLSGSICPNPPADYADFISYPPIVLRGDLDGCWYTKIDTFKDNGAPSGIYLETGREVFVGRLNDGPVGLFATTYRFESKWDPDVSTGSEVVGRCQHPIVSGSGTGGFAGVTGHINFKDVVADGSYEYRGHVSIP